MNEADFHFESTDFESTGRVLSEDELAFAGLPDFFAAPPQLSFVLTDDCDGRFVIDRETGIVMLACEDVLAHDRGATFTARIRVTEGDGFVYELSMPLIITGMVPQMAGIDTPAF